MAADHRWRLSRLAVVCALFAASMAGALLLLPIVALAQSAPPTPTPASSTTGGSLDDATLDQAGTLANQPATPTPSATPTPAAQGTGTKGDDKAPTHPSTIPLWSNALTPERPRPAAAPGAVPNDDTDPEGGGTPTDTPTYDSTAYDSSGHIGGSPTAPPAQPSATPVAAAPPTPPSAGPVNLTVASTGGAPSTSPSAAPLTAGMSTSNTRSVTSATLVAAAPATPPSPAPVTSSVGAAPVATPAPAPAPTAASATPVTPVTVSAAGGPAAPTSAPASSTSATPTPTPTSVPAAPLTAGIPPKDSLAGAPGAEPVSAGSIGGQGQGQGLLTTARQIAQAAGYGQAWAKVEQAAAVGGAVLDEVAREHQLGPVLSTTESILATSAEQTFGPWLTLAGAMAARAPGATTMAAAGTTPAGAGAPVTPGTATAPAAEGPPAPAADRAPAPAADDSPWSWLAGLLAPPVASAAGPGQAQPPAPTSTPTPEPTAGPTAAPAPVPGDQPIQDRLLDWFALNPERVAQWQQGKFFPDDAQKIAANGITANFIILMALTKRFVPAFAGLLPAYARDLGNYAQIGDQPIFVNPVPEVLGTFVGMSAVAIGADIGSRIANRAYKDIPAPPFANGALFAEWARGSKLAETIRGYPAALKWVEDRNLAGLVVDPHPGIAVERPAQWVSFRGVTAGQLIVLYAMLNGAVNVLKPAIQATGAWPTPIGKDADGNKVWADPLDPWRDKLYYGLLNTGGLAGFVTGLDVYTAWKNQKAALAALKGVAAPEVLARLRGLDLTSLTRAGGPTAELAAKLKSIDPALVGALEKADPAVLGKLKGANPKVIALEATLLGVGILWQTLDGAIEADPSLKSNPYYHYYAPYKDVKDAVVNGVTGAWDRAWYHPSPFNRTELVGSAVLNAAWAQFGDELTYANDRGALYVGGGLYDFGNLLSDVKDNAVRGWNEGQSYWPGTPFQRDDGWVETAATVHAAGQALFRALVLNHPDQVEAERQNAERSASEAAERADLFWRRAVEGDPRATTYDHLDQALANAIDLVPAGGARLQDALEWLTLWRGLRHQLGGDALLFNAEREGYRAAEADSTANARRWGDDWGRLTGDLAYAFGLSSAPGAGPQAPTAQPAQATPPPVTPAPVPVPATAVPAVSPTSTAVAPSQGQAATAPPAEGAPTWVLPTAPGTAPAATPPPAATPLPDIKAHTKNQPAGGSQGQVAQVAMAERPTPAGARSGGQWGGPGDQAQAQPAGQPGTGGGAGHGGQEPALALVGTSDGAGQARLHARPAAFVPAGPAPAVGGQAAGYAAGPSSLLPPGWPLGAPAAGAGAGDEAARAHAGHDERAAVAGAPGALPFTGGHAPDLLAAGLGCLAAGGVVVLGTRRPERG